LRGRCGGGAVDIGVVRLGRLAEHPAKTSSLRTTRRFPPPWSGAYSVQTLAQRPPLDRARQQWLHEAWSLVRVAV
jgi:hypothetical protein